MRSGNYKSWHTITYLGFIFVFTTDIMSLGFLYLEMVKVTRNKPQAPNKKVLEFWTDQEKDWTT